MVRNSDEKVNKDSRKSNSESDKQKRSWGAKSATEESSENSDEKQCDGKEVRIATRKSELAQRRKKEASTAMKKQWR